MMPVSTQSAYVTIRPWCQHHNTFKKKTGLPHRLVLAGEGVEYGEKIHDMVFNCEYASDIFIVGYFPHDSFIAFVGL